MSFTLPTSVTADVGANLFSGNKAQLFLSQVQWRDGVALTTDEVTIANGAAAAAADSASVTLAAAPASPIPDGVVVEFANGVNVTTVGITTTTTMNVVPKHDAIPANNAGKYRPFVPVPLATALPFSTPQGATVDKQIYGGTDSISLKVGRDQQSFAVQALGEASDPALASAIKAAQETSPASSRYFIYVNGDEKTGYTGALDVLDENPTNPVRDAMERTLNMKTIVVTPF
jgi:hypothetical protein